MSTCITFSDFLCSVDVGVPGEGKSNPWVPALDMVVLMGVIGEGGGGSWGGLSDREEGEELAKEWLLFREILCTRD